MNKLAKKIFDILIKSTEEKKTQEVIQDIADPNDQAQVKDLPPSPQGTLSKSKEKGINKLQVYVFKRKIKTKNNL